MSDGVDEVQDDQEDDKSEDNGASGKSISLCD